MGCKDNAQAAAPAQTPPPPQVTVAPAELQPIPWRASYAGRVEGVRQVQVRARVSGILLERAYVEGSLVKEGDLLFRIDPETFEVNLLRAKAQEKRAQAALDQANRDWTRVQALFGKDAISERERDESQSAFELAQAELAVAQAEVKAAQLELDYTMVKAPLDGVSSLEELPEGSLVRNEELMTQITQLDPIYVTFSVGEADPVFNQIIDAMPKNGDVAELAVSMLDRTGQPLPFEGKVEFTASAIDTATGTLRVRATFANPEHKLLPGQFVRVLFENLNLPDGVVVPEKSLLPNPAGAAVYVVAEDNSLATRPVKLGPLIDQGQVIEGGLEPGDRVVVSGVMKLRPGMPVQINTGVAQ